jgi:hypothetical protein
MPYTNGQATPRSDIYALVQSANEDFESLFIADKILPVKGEDAKRGIYMRAYLEDAQLLDLPTINSRAPGTSYDRYQPEYDIDTYDCIEYGGEIPLDDAFAEETSRFMNLEATEAAKLERRYRIYYEQRVANLIYNSSTFTATAATAAYTQANLATIDVANDVDLAKNRALLNGSIPNAVVMSYPVFQRIRRATLLQNQIYGIVPRGANQRMLPGAEDVARALGVDQIYIGMAVYNSTPQNNTVGYTGNFVWPNTYIAVLKIVEGDYQAGGTGRTIQWTKDTQGLFLPETYRDDSKRSNILRVRQHTAEKVLDATTCQLITTSYA